MKSLRFIKIVLKLRNFTNFSNFQRASMAETVDKLPSIPPTESAVSSANICSEKKRQLCEDEEVKTDGDKSGARSRTKRGKPEVAGPVLDKPEFYFDSGLRKVRPYWFRYVAWAKQRWYGRTLGDVFHNEMNAKDPDFFREQIKLGRVTVNDQPTSIDYVVKNNDNIKNILHRHEMPVLDTPIEVILNDDAVVVVNKPCSIPVHPCGRYHFNSLTYLLRNEFGFENLRVTHRLDRMTSGLVIFAKTLFKAQELFSQHTQKDLNKEYLCRVEGNFPDDEVCCDAPLDQLFPKMGIRCVSPNGKPSRTRFQKLFSEGNESIVRCILETGRTHQIRVHLQYLGYPIVNDYMYNSEVFGPEKGKGAVYGKSVEQLCKDLAVAFGAESWVDDFDDSLASFVQRRPQSSMDAPSAKPDPGSPDYDPYCADCHMTSRDPSAYQMKMYLHCLKYEGPNWSYSTPMPSWALRSSEKNEHTAAETC